MLRSHSWSRSKRHSAQATFGPSAPSGPSHNNSHSTNHLEASSARVSLNRSLSTDVPTHGSSLRGMRRLEARRQMEENNLLSSKRRDFNLPVDMRLLDYTSSYDENLMCPICRCPFVDPVVLTECDHCFCRDCLRQTWMSTYTPLGPRGNCPSCRTPAKLGPRNAASKILCNILDDLLVQCPRHEEGCTATVKRGEVQDHVSLYCGYAFKKCTAEDCGLPVQRKYAGLGCLHYGVSCLDCHQSMTKATLGTHWKSGCPDRKVPCSKCKEQIFSRELESHSRETCAAISIACPGASIGCMNISQRSQADNHAMNCTFAKLAPVLATQKERLDEQEATQKSMSRKLEILESGVQAMQDVLYTKNEDPYERVADETRIPLLHGPAHPPTGAEEGVAEAFQSRAPPSSRPTSTVPGVISPQSVRAPASLSPSRATPEPPSPRPYDLPEPFSAYFDMPSPFPPPASQGPYVSPLHHLLSMHESLRDELSRMQTTLQEMDGRHSMQRLNEDLRTREEISYLRVQVAGLSRQVRWSTSAQLQRQSRSGTPVASGLSVGGSGTRDSGTVGASVGLEAAVSAVSTAATALRGAARIAGGQEQSMRRGMSEEGQTKL